MKNCEIRCDDILQVSGISKHQAIQINKDTLFDLFKKADIGFALHQYPCILAICAEGISRYPYWVDYIRRMKHRFQIELHCNKHQNYKFLPREKIKSELKKAIDKIEKTFDCKITTWYPPKGRKGEPEDKDKICEELGIKCFQQKGKVDAKLWLKNPEKYPHINFHFWHKGQVETINKILCRLKEENLKTGLK